MRNIPDSTVRRLATYLHFLEEFEAEGVDTISSEELARRGATTSAQVRKDLSFFGSFGKRGLGYRVGGLARRLREILGLDRAYRVAVVGAGRIGSALAQHRGFQQRGFNIVAVYDEDPKKVGARWNGQAVRHISDLARDAAERRLDMGIIVTPAAAAQQVAAMLVDAGVGAILNFAPVQLEVPEGISVKNVNLALELETLSYALAHR